MKKRVWFERIDTPLWRKLAFALVDVVDGLVNIVLAPFGWHANISWEFVLFVRERELAKKAGVNVDGR